MRKPVLAAALLFSLAAQAEAQAQTQTQTKIQAETPTGPAGILVHHGAIIETAKPGLTTQAFVEIDNSETMPDTLISAGCPIAGATTVVDKNGAPIVQLPVAPGAKLTLNAAGPHLLLQSTHFSIDPGGAIPCSLTFRNAGEILVYLYPVPAA